MAQPVVAQSAAVILVCAFLSLLWPGGQEEPRNNSTLKLNYTEYNLRYGKNPPKITIDIPDGDPTFRRTHIDSSRRYQNVRRGRAFYSPEYEQPDPSQSSDLSGAVVLHGSYDERRDAYLNRMLLLNDTFQGGVVAVDVLNLFGALVLWMAVITSLVIVIIWLLCQHGRDQAPKIGDDIDGVKSKIEELQSSLGHAMDRYRSPYKSIVTEETETLNGPRTRLNTSNYDQLDNVDETREYSRRYTRTYRDEDRLRDLDDISHERKEAERRREEEAMRKRQEQLDEQRRRREEYYYDETRTRKSSPRGISTPSNYGQNATKKSTYQWSDNPNRVVFYN